MNKTLSVVACLAAASLACGNAFAVGQPKVAGFVSYGVTKGVMPEGVVYDYGLADDELNLDTRDTRVGIQISADIDDNTSITTQFIGRGGPESDYHMNVDWGYINYNLGQSFKLRLGKYKINQFLVSDYADVGYAYPWVRPPQDVYGTNPLVSLDGFDLLFKKPLGKVNLLAQIYYGSGNHHSNVPYRFAAKCQAGETPFDPAQCPPGGMDVEFATRFTHGWNFGIGNDVATLRLGYFSTRVDVPAMGLDDVWGSFGGVGFTMDWHNLVTFAEYISRDTDDNLAAAFPDQKAWYITQGYRVGKVLPIFTYSHIRKGVDPSLFAIEQHSVAMGLRMELSGASTLKFEAMKVVPEDGNEGLFISAVKDAKIYSLVFDTIF